MTKRALDPYTLWAVSRWHGRVADNARAANHTCGDVIHTFSARYWEARARKLEKQLLAKPTPAEPDAESREGRER